MTPPWRTAADQAELESLWREFLFALDSHDRRCAECLAYNAGESPVRCAGFGEVVMAIVAWRELRSTASFAAGMRRMQDGLAERSGTERTATADGYRQQVLRL